jgi:hypothetical protein
MSKWLRTYQPHRATSEIPVGTYSMRCAPPNLESVLADEHVVQLITRDYMCVNKPPDVRMDGDFDVTVEKLLRKWLVPYRI